MIYFRQPDELKLTGNVDKNWKAFKQKSFELSTPAVGLKGNKEEKSRTANSSMPCRPGCVQHACVVLQRRRCSW